MKLFHTKFIELIASQNKPDVYIELGICGAWTFNEIAPHAKEAYAVELGGITPNMLMLPCVRAFGETSTDDFFSRWLLC